MTGKKPSSPTELKVADALAECSAWDEGSEVSEGDLWALVQPRLPRGDAGRAFAERYSKKAAGLTEAECIGAGQRMFFDSALKVMEKNGQLKRGTSGLWLGSEPLWRRAGERAVEIYTPGLHGLKDAEARKRAADRKLLNRILSRKAFEVRPDSENYQAIRSSFLRYGIRPEHPIVIDDSTEPPFVLDGRTRLAVARELEMERELLSYAHKVRADGSYALNELILANLHRRQLTSKEIGAVRDLLEENDSSLEAEELKRIQAAFQENEDRLQRGTAEKRERITQALADYPDESHNSIAKMLGVSPTTVGTACAEVSNLETSEPCRHGLTGQGSRAGSKQQPQRKISDEQIEEIIADDLPWPEIVSRYGVGQSAAQSAKTRAMERKRSRAPQPGPPATGAAETSPAAEAAATESAWTKIMRRLGRLSDLWHSGPPDAASELEELEALKREIDERITTLRG